MKLHHDPTLVLSIIIPDFSYGIHLSVYRTRQKRNFGLSFFLTKETRPTPKQYSWIYVNWRQLWIF
mgnify:FL=1